MRSARAAPCDVALPASRLPRPYLAPRWLTACLRVCAEALTLLPARRRLHGALQQGAGRCAPCMRPPLLAPSCVTICRRAHQLASTVRSHRMILQLPSHSARARRKNRSCYLLVSRGYMSKCLQEPGKYPGSACCTSTGMILQTMTLLT